MNKSINQPSPRPEPSKEAAASGQFSGMEFDTRSIGEQRMKVDLSGQSGIMKEMESPLMQFRYRYANSINELENMKGTDGRGDKARLLSIAQTKLQEAFWAIQEALTP